MSKYSDLAAAVVNLIGGKENVSNAWHCVTRLRFNLKDDKKVKIDEIKKMNGVLGAQFSGDQFQVIIGNSVSDVYEEVSNILGNLSPQTNDKKSGQKVNIVSSLMSTIAGIFTPILPALAGTGLLKGFLSIFLALGLISDESALYIVLSMIGDCVFYFMPFFLAVSAARKFQVNEFLGLAIAGVLLYPTMVNGDPEVPMMLFGVLPIPFVTYTSSVIPIILGVFCLKYVYKFIKKIVPDVISMMFTPMLSLLVTVPFTLVVLGPLGTYVGEILTIVVTWLFKTVGFVSSGLIGALYPVLVMTGMHYALDPVTISNFTTFGYDNGILPAVVAATFAMAGATFGVFLTTKDKEMKQLSLSSGISAIIGITEPAMYGVTLKLKYPFYAAMAGGAVGSILLNFINAKQSVFVIPGIMALTGFIEADNSMAVILATIICFGTFALALILTMAMSKGKRGNNDATKESAENRGEFQNNKIIEVYAPAKGKIIPVETLEDQTFAGQIMGHTSAIMPSDGTVYCPVDAEVVLVADTKHAIGLRNKEGVEILIHVGIDTVELNGEGLETFVSVGDHVNKGDKILKENVSLITEKKYNPVVLTIVTNTDNFLNIISTNKEDEVLPGDLIFTVIN